ncbi:MAG TPA: PDZ domain-containing protein [Polyangiaceae bacterium]
MSTWTSTRAIVPDAYRQLRARLRGALSGLVRSLVVSGALLTVGACRADHGTIGAVLAQAPDRRLTVREVPPGLSAAEGGVLPGDEILLIDGRDVRGMSSEHVHQALGGEVGEPVKLTLIRGDRVVRVTLRRTPARPHRMPGSGSPQAP